MKVLRVVLLIHGLITLAGFVVLTAVPTAIPAMVGITLQLILATFVVLYLVSGVLDLVYLQQIGVNRTMIVNAVLRFTVVAILLTAWRVSRPHQTPGTSR